MTEVAQETPVEPVEIQAQTSTGIPQLIVEVAPGSKVSHQDTMFLEGEQITLDGPTALNLFQSGYVTIKGTVTA